MFTEVINGIITLPDAPPVPGLAFRNFRGPSDFPKMVAVIAGSKDADQIERVDTVEDVARNYSHLVNCDPYRDVLLAEVDGQVISYNRVAWRAEATGARIYLNFGFLLPEWRRQGIGGAMQRQAERRLREIAADHPQDGPRFFESFASDTEIGATALLESAGYSPVRHFFNMVRPDLENIPDLPLPPGLEVRPVLPEHYRTIYDASQEAFQDHWGYSPDEDPYESFIDNRNFDPTLWRVAWDGDQVAGMVLNFIDEPENREYNRKRGWTENICVRRPWRKQGVARALIAISLQALKERGMAEAALGVDTENISGALRLYEGMGFRPVKRMSNYRKPMV
jgi:ribosomal protein S18 acetylase RimI-like enzyme